MLRSCKVVGEECYVTIYIYIYSKVYIALSVEQVTPYII